MKEICYETWTWFSNDSVLLDEISRRGVALIHNYPSLWKTDSIYTEFWQHGRNYCHILKSFHDLHLLNQYISYVHFLENVNCVYLDLTNTLF